MRDDSMCLKVVVFMCVLVFMSMNFIFEGYSQTQTELNVSVEKQSEGRSLMVASVFAYGIGLYGPGTAILLGTDSASQVTALEFLFGGSAFAGGLMATRDYRLGAGRTNLILGSAWAGTLYGIGIPILFESENPKVYFGSMMIATPLGGYLGYRLTSHRWYKKGESNMIVNGGAIGGLYGLAIPYLIDIEGLEAATQSKIYTVSALLGIPIGAVASSRIFHNQPISDGRSHLINFGGAVGAYYAIGITSLFDVESGRPYVATAMFGLPVGTYLGYRFTTKESYTRGRSFLVQLGAYAGALFANAIPLLMETESHKPHVVASILGSAGGMWLAHQGTRGWGEKAPLAMNRHIPQYGKVKVRLPSVNEWFTLGLMTLRKPSHLADIPVELLRVSF